MTPYKRARSMTRRVTTVAVSALALSLAVPVTTAHADDDSITVAGITIPLKPGCVSIAPYRVPLDELRAEVSDYKDRLAAEGINIDPAELLAYVFPGAQGRSFLITDPGTGFELCPPKPPAAGTDLELVAIAVGYQTPQTAVDLGIDLSDPSTVNTDQQDPEERNGRWRQGPRQCFVKGVEGHSRRDVCWEHDTQIDDSDPNNNFHQFFARASGWRTEAGEYMKRIWVDAD